MATSNWVSNRYAFGPAHLRIPAFAEDSTNKFFNDNWRMLADALYSVITQTIEDILLDVLKKIFHFIPANFFVSDIPTPEQLYGKTKSKPK